MDNLLSRLGRFRLKEEVAKALFEAEPIEKNQTEVISEKEEIEASKEENLLFLKSVACPICDTVFRALQLKSGKARRKESDLDLRPRFEDIDANKYDVASCPKCGFTAMHRFIVPLPPVHKKLIKEGVCDKFKTPPAQALTEVRAYTYDEAIGLYKLAIYATAAKNGPSSEKAYACLKIAWLLRGKIERLEVEKDKNQKAILVAQKEYDAYYIQAFDGFVKAMASEDYPICGMDQSTLDLMIAAMAYNLEKYEYASRFVSELLVSRVAGINIKNRARDLKDLIVEKLKK